MTFVFYFLMARYLGDIGIGKYSFTVGLISILFIISGFGLDNLIVREVSINKNKASQYLSNAVTIKTGLSLVAILLLFIFLPLLGKSADVNKLVLLFCLTLFFENITTSIEAIFNAFERLHFIAIMEVSYNILKVILALFIKFYGGQLEILIICLVLISGIKCLFTQYILKRYFFKWHYIFKFTRLKTLLLKSYPFALMGAISIIYLRIDLVMLSTLIGDSITGQYAVAFNFITLFMALSYGFSRSFYPILSRLYHESRQAFFAAGEKGLNYLFAAALPIAIIITILAPKIIMFIFGSQFADSAIAVQVLIWTIPFLFMNAPLLRMLYSANHQNDALKIAIIGTIFNITMNILLIPRISFLGASISTVLSELLTFLLYYNKVKSVLNYHIRFNQTALAACLAIIPLALLLLVLQQWFWIITFICSILVYLFVFVLIGGIPRHDLIILKVLITKHILKERA
ncbi:flippase [bacterium]|nr:flippase [bacterium]